MTAATLSIALPTYSAEDPHGWGHVADRARAAEAAGFDRILVSDHVVFGEDLEAYGRPETGGIEGGRQPTGPDGHWLEPLTALTYVAALTSRVRLGTNILLAALRRPVVLAKTLATLDVLSGGRVDLGVGIGWQREEYEAAGLDFATRGRLLDDSLEVLQVLWTSQSASIELPSLRFENIHMMPKPLQPGGVPLWVSGRVNDRVAHRIARYGSGWIPWGDDAADLPTSIPRMREAVAGAGGNAEALQVAANLAIVRSDDRSIDAGRTMAEVPRLIEAGVTDFRAFVRPLPETYDEALEPLSAIVQVFRDGAPDA
jgi:probable F420-dependent oxidoreductase